MRDFVVRCRTPGCAGQFGIHERGHACHHVTCALCHEGMCYACGSGWPCTSEPRCSMYCDDRCRCPDCTTCRPGAPCSMCSNDWRCRSCNPPRNERR
jgi:hypothetical protein